jgi:prepilin-type N-terminal cleavage/methylation domain-containing protein
MSRRLGARGFTLLEMMLVVALSAIMAALAFAGYQEATTIGRVNGESEVLSNFLRLARLRAVSTGCGHTVRIRGPGFIEAGQASGQILLIRERGCAVTGGASGNLLLQPGDEVVNSYNMDRRILLVSPTRGDATNLSLYYGFDPNGAFVQGIEDPLGTILAPDPLGVSGLTSASASNPDGGAAGIAKRLQISGGGNVSW